MLRPGPSSATAAGLGAILLWGLTVALARSLTEALGPFRAAAAVQVVAGVLCLAHLALMRGAVRGLRELPRRYLLVCGALFVLYMGTLFTAIGLAVDRQQMLEVALVNYLWCPLTLLLSIPILGKRAGVLLVPGIALVVAGLYLVLLPAGGASGAALWSNVAGNPLAYALALIAAVTWALYSNLTRLLSGAESAGGVLLFLPVAGAVLLGCSLARPEEGAWTLRATIEVVILGASTATAYHLWDLAMRKGDVVLVAACSYFTPFLATLVSSLYLAVMPGASLWIGCLLLVLGSLASWVSVSDRRSPGTPIAG